MAKTAHNSRIRDEIARGLAFFAGLLRERRNVMAATDNLTSMHKREEELRASRLAAIEADGALSDHWNLVAEAMNAIYAFTHDHPHGSENELTLQYLGIRLFDAAGASIKLALSGSYQKAKSRRQRHKASDDPQTLPGGRQQLVVEVPRDEVWFGIQGVGSTVDALPSSGPPMA
jgi:hypothetical protein